MKEGCRRGMKGEWDKGEGQGQDGIEERREGWRREMKGEWDVGQDGMQERDEGKMKGEG